MIKAPIRFSPELEQQQPDEADIVRQLCDAFDVILEKTTEDYGRAVRSVHAKAHGVMKGEFIVAADLPSELAQGLFASPARYAALIRTSTNAGDILPDTISLPRGLAIKVLGVTGERLPGAEGSAQDFVTNNGEVFVAKDAGAFLRNVKMLARTTDRLEGTKEVLSSALRGVHNALETFGTSSPTVDTLGGAPNVDPLGETYHSVTPYRWGDHVAKYRLVPITAEQIALKGRIVDAADRPDAIRTDLRAEMARLDAEWAFEVQLCRDLEKQPIEDPTVAWDEEVSPFQRVAVLRVPAQDSWDPAQVHAIDEQTRFSIWTGLAAHQPLGNINRARNATYRHSADYRARVNRCPYHEPAGIDP
ncbi:catalase family protein [Sphingomonas sp. TZW2008]|uniref:catalase family protein n=1 Tax=Sphingomonas sp. TZW2008 TaxID=1917973 RepID=UPI000A26C710|nr:catalase family protein [Sphingomonas sp. TZW2008]